MGKKKAVTKSQSHAWGRKLFEVFRKQAADAKSAAIGLNNHQQEEEQGQSIPKYLPIFVGHEGQGSNRLVEPVIRVFPALERAQRSSNHKQGDA